MKLNSNLNLNSSKAFVINSKIHTPIRVEQSGKTTEERGMWRGRECCQCCLRYGCCLQLPMLFCLNIYDEANTRIYNACACIRTWVRFIHLLLPHLFLLLFCCSVLNKFNYAEDILGIVESKEQHKQQQAKGEILFFTRIKAINLIYIYTYICKYALGHNKMQQNRN